MANDILPTRVAAWRVSAERPALLRLLLVLSLFIAADGAAVLVWRGTSSAAANTGSLASLPGPGAAAATVPVHDPAPVAVNIDSIGVHAGIVNLVLGHDGTLGVPGDFGAVGWWSQASTPGAPGAAVLVGHVDSYKSAAVFYRLRDLAPGATVAVRRADASTVTFVVDALRQYPKDRLPTQLLYGPTAAPTLRLITCGGAFDRTHHSYEDNVVAFAHLQAPPPAAGRAKAE